MITSQEKINAPQIENDEAEPLSFDETVRRALAFCDTLPGDFAPFRKQLAELQTRLSGGRLHLAVLGQFNRGKSTFINALLGIKVLPASVLPLTSVPTIVEYGAQLTCKISFLDGQDDLIVKGTETDITGALRKYVAEANNPKNILRVKAATITCNSELLANGTVIIDTPGFGSTHLHNTETTLTLLSECDAAIFLLSADPPMTQTEMEFLRGVKNCVPKIFFALNKSDLLTRQGLGEVDEFIKNILIRELDFPIDTTLYHVSAIQGERAKTANVADPHWKASGLEEVKKEALDFMLREKYFTLAEALLGKYDEAKASIAALIKKHLDDLLTPMHIMQDEINTITNVIQSLSLELSTELKTCANERETINAKIGAWAAENSTAYLLSMKKALLVLLNGRHAPNVAANIAATMLPKHASSLGAQFLDAAANLANKSIRAIASRHAEALARLSKRYTMFLEGGDPMQIESAEEIIARLEIESASNVFSEVPAWDTPPPHIMDAFKKISTRLDTVREFYEPLCEESVRQSIDNAEMRAVAAVDAAWNLMQDTINSSYKILIDKLNALYTKRQTQLSEMENASKREILSWRERQREIASL